MKYASVQFQGMEHLIPFSQVVSKFNFLFITKEGKSVELAKKLKAEGNNVKVHFTSKDKSFFVEGGVGNWESWKGWADVIVWDDEAVKEKMLALKNSNYYCVDFAQLKNETGEQIYKLAEGVK
jgi:hypothetical protein